MLLYLLPIISSQFQPYSVIKHLTIPEKVKHQVNIVRLFSSSIDHVDLPHDFKRQSEWSRLCAKFQCVVDLYDEDQIRHKTYMHIQSW